MSMPGPPPDEFLIVLESLVQALNRINDTIRQIGGLSHPVTHAILHEQQVPPPMPRLVAGQWPARDGDHFPRGA